MKTIAELNGADFLRQCNKIRHKASFLMKETEVLEIRKKAPAFDGTETTEEKNKKIKEQSYKNLSEMIDCLMDKHPDATAELLELLVVKEEGDENLLGIDLFMAGMEVLSHKKVVDFFSSLVRLEQTSTAD